MSDSKMLKAPCRDPECRAALCFSALESMIECIQCGQTHSKDSLTGVEEVGAGEKAWVVGNLVRRMLVGVPKRGPETVRVLGLSNYDCKLLAPLLTRFGMDRATYKAKPLSEMGRGDTLDCGVFGDRAFLIAPEHIKIPGFGRDATGSALYLHETLDLIKAANGGEERLVAVHADGDGHCLVHAISRALVGRELFWHPLRTALKMHFRDHLDKYKELFKDFIDTDEWPSIIEECDPEFKPPEGELHGLRNIHIFGLANVLKRPIILLDSYECMKKCGDYSALFLPGFVSPEDCRGKDNNLNKPICIAWSSFSHNHYIPLVGVQNMPLPVLPTSLVPKVWGMPQSQILLYMVCDDDGNCQIGGSRTLSDAYLKHLVTAMEELFLQQHGVHPNIVADAKLYLCQDNAFVNTSVSSVITTSRICVEQGRLYRCLSCRGLCELRIDAGSFQRGGVFYNSLLENYQRLESHVPYRLNGIYCTYDVTDDSITADLRLSYLERCKWCNSPDVRRINPDGTLLDDHRIEKVLEKRRQPLQPDKKVPKPFKEEDSKVIHIQLEWGGRMIENMIPWSAFQQATGNSINNAVSHLAANLIKMHFPEEISNAALQSYVRREIWQKVGRNEMAGSSQKPDVQKIAVKSVEEKTTLPVQVEEVSQYTSSSTSDLQYIKVVSCKGKQVNLSLNEEGISYEQLRLWIRREFDIPVPNQRIKLGFPPKELEVPTKNKQALHLKHGDRLLVENCIRPSNQQKPYSNSPYIRNRSSPEKDTSRLQRDAVWRIAVFAPEDFRSGGSYYEEVAQKHILTDQTHLTIDSFPFKSFSYNVLSDRLELCIKGVGHFDISPDLQARIEQVQAGGVANGFRKCVYTQRDIPITSTVRKVHSSNQDSSVSSTGPLVRKGPGFSILTPTDLDDMDLS